MEIYTYAGVSYVSFSSSDCSHRKAETFEVINVVFLCIRLRDGLSRATVLIDFWPSSIQYNIQCALCQCGDGPTIYVDFWPSSMTFLSLAVSEMSYCPSWASWIVTSWTTLSVDRHESAITLQCPIRRRWPVRVDWKDCLKEEMEIYTDAEMSYVLFFSRSSDFSQRKSALSSCSSAFGDPKSPGKGALDLGLTYSTVSRSHL